MAISGELFIGVGCLKRLHNIKIANSMSKAFAYGFKTGLLENYLIRDVSILYCLQSLESRDWIWVPQAILQMKGVDYVANRFLKIGCTISEKRCSGILRHKPSCKWFLQSFPVLAVPYCRC